MPFFDNKIYDCQVFTEFQLDHQGTEVEHTEFIAKVDNCIKGHDSSFLDTTDHFNVRISNFVVLFTNEGSGMEEQHRWKHHMAHIACDDVNVATIACFNSESYLAGVGIAPGLIKKLDTITLSV